MSPKQLLWIKIGLAASVMLMFVMMWLIVWKLTH